MTQKRFGTQEIIGEPEAIPAQTGSLKLVQKLFGHATIDMTAEVILTPPLKQNVK